MSIPADDPTKVQPDTYVPYAQVAPASAPSSAAASAAASAPYIPGIAVEQRGHLLGHKLIHIQGRGTFVDASQNGNTAYFAYKGFHTLKLTQYITVAILTAMVAAVAIAGIILTGGIGIGVGLVLVLAVGGLGCWAVHAFNKYDPTYLAAQRAHLLNNNISEPSSLLLTDSEKATNFANDYRLSPRQAYDHFQALPRVVELDGSQREVDVAIGELRTVITGLTRLDGEVDARMAPVRAQAEALQQEAHANYTDSTSHHVGVGLQAAGLGMMAIGAITNTSTVTGIGAGAAIAGTYIDHTRQAEYRGQVRSIERQVAVADRFVRHGMNFEGRKQELLSQAVAPIGFLKAKALRTASRLSRVLTNNG